MAKVRTNEAAWAWICDRLPEKRQQTATSSLRPLRSPESPNHTVPTGFSGLPPVGPAIPVTERTKGAGVVADNPWTMAKAVWPETAPHWASVEAETPRNRCFASLEYVTKPPQNTSEAPATLVSRWATSPPVHDSATATVRPRRRKASRNSLGVGLKRFKGLFQLGRSGHKNIQPVGISKHLDLPFKHSPIFHSQLGRSKVAD